MLKVTDNGGVVGWQAPPGDGAADRSTMRLRVSVLAIAALVAALVWAPSVAAVSPGATPLAARTAPKVVLVVGPVAGTTQEYRSLADDAASAALEFTPNVVRVYSPNATWSAVRRALEGASVVVYLGHGNGWPSPYRNSLYGATQNGFGLNPVAGVDDNAHQYFGEDRIATEVRLAPNAIVILSRLCYASGNSEPGRAEGTIDVARQRVDNYAAGFIAAGAGAVIAEAHSGPAWYVRQALSGAGLVDRMWSSALTAHGHLTTFESIRSPGFAVAMDPDQKWSGFYRSIVYRPGLTLGPARAGRPVRVQPVPSDPTLIGTVESFGSAKLTGRPVAGRKAHLSFRYHLVDGASLPEGIRIGARWDPIDVAPAAAVEQLSPAANEDLVAPETLGSVVDPVAAKVGLKALSIPIAIPSQRGRYRLVVTLHDASGEAFDAATQALVRNAIVRVTGDTDVSYAAAAAIEAQAGSDIALPVGVTNLGTGPWGYVGAGRRHRPEPQSANATLIARWVALTTESVDTTGTDAFVDLPAALAPTTRADVVLTTHAPIIPGDYLLVLDTIVPDRGSLTALGVDPALVRVTISAAVDTRHP